MGESLIYSWLRHIKECQIVQTNWKPCLQWDVKHIDELETIMNESRDFFKERLNYDIYKFTKGLNQLLKQAECDVIGIKSLKEIFAVDIAFHEKGLLYGKNKTETAAKVIAKCIRTAMCIYGFMDKDDASIIFASPKITPSYYQEINTMISILNEFFSERNLGFVFSIIANNDFNEQIIAPVLSLSKEIADTSELFLRSFQLVNLFKANQ